MFYGFGINDGIYRWDSKEYRTWLDMVRRCYDTSQKENPRFKTYVGCTVTENWTKTSDFGDWANTQKGFGLPEYMLDKDLLVTNNKIYSPETCCFVPREINMALTFREADRGEYPLGVKKERVRKDGSIALGVKVRRGELSTITKVFSDVVEASDFYIKTKKDYLTYLAEKHKNQIEEKVYLALVNYEFR